MHMMRHLMNAPDEYDVGVVITNDGLALQNLTIVKLVFLREQVNR